MHLVSIDPTTGEELATYPAASAAEIAALLARTAAAQRAWRHASFAERVKPLLRVAHLLRERAGELALGMAREMGKPIVEGRAEIEKCAWTAEHYATYAELYLAPEQIPTDATRSLVTFAPLGVILGVMPWNFPFWQVFRFALPALAAGNAAVLKHASNVCGSALAIEEIFTAAALPRDLFRTLLIDSAAVAAVIESPHVAAVTLTGSAPAGRAVAAKAGACLKKSVLELGGSDPYVVLADADLASAAELCARSRLLNGGQSCIAAKRFIVVEPVREEFTRRFRDQLGSTKMGDPTAESTRLGPQARHDLRDALHLQVEQSLARGARLELGGEIPPGPGAFYPPTLLSNVQPGMPAFDEELFGPVAAVVPARDEAHALELANASSFGLGAAIFTRDVAHGERLATHHLEAGSCFVNDFVRSDPRLPFGGIKQSGYGRELGSFGIREFVNTKTLWVR